MLPLPDAAPAAGGAGYLDLLAQLTKVGDYDEATFKGAGAAWPGGPGRGGQHSAAAGVCMYGVGELLSVRARAAPAGRFDAMAAQPDTYQIVVIEGELRRCEGAGEEGGGPAFSPPPAACAADLDKGRIIGTATLFIEQKFIRDCGKCGHIEDVVVDASYRGLRLGKRCVAGRGGAAAGRGWWVGRKKRRAAGWAEASPAPACRDARGRRVIDAVIEAAEGAGCYKVILDCSDDNAAFYSKCGLVKKEIQMVSGRAQRSRLPGGMEGGRAGG